MFGSILFVLMNVSIHFNDDSLNGFTKLDKLPRADQVQAISRSIEDRFTAKFSD